MSNLSSRQSRATRQQGGAAAAAAELDAAATSATIAEQVQQIKNINLAEKGVLTRRQNQLLAARAAAAAAAAAATKPEVPQGDGDRGCTSSVNTSATTAVCSSSSASSSSSSVASTTSSSSQTSFTFSSQILHHNNSHNGRSVTLADPRPKASQQTLSWMQHLPEEMPSSSTSSRLANGTTAVGRSRTTRSTLTSSRNANSSDRRLRSSSRLSETNNNSNGPVFSNPAANTHQMMPQHQDEVSRDSLVSEADGLFSSDEHPDASNSSFQSTSTNDLIVKILEKGPRAQEKLLHAVQFMQNANNQEVQPDAVANARTLAQELSRYNHQHRQQRCQQQQQQQQQQQPHSTSQRPQKRKDRPSGNPNVSTLSNQAGVSKRKRDRLPVATHNLIGVHRHMHEGVSEFGDGVLITMRRREQHNRPDVAYLENQANLTRDMRATLFDWMFEVGQEFVLNRETLHTALTFVDRYLSRAHHVARRKLQLVGVTALWLAAKGKEVYPPRAKEFAYTTDRAYETSHMVEMEMDMLTKLEWVLDPITPYLWVDWYLHELFYYTCLDEKEAKNNQCQPHDEKATGTAVVGVKRTHSMRQASSSSSTSSSSSLASTSNIASALSTMNTRTSTRNIAGSTRTSRNTRARNGLEPCCADAEAPSTRSESHLAGFTDDNTNNNNHSNNVVKSQQQERDEKTKFYMASTRVPIVIFSRIMEIIDTALLDMNSLHFLPSALAATAVAHVIQEMNIADMGQIERVTGYSEGELLLCRDWMSFAFELPPNESPNHPKHKHILHFYEDRDLHCIQRHNGKSLGLYKNHAPQFDIMTQATAPVSSAQWSNHGTMTNSPLDAVENSLDNADISASFQRERTNASFVPPTPQQERFAAAATGKVQQSGSRASRRGAASRRRARDPPTLVLDASFTSVDSSASGTSMASSSSTMIDATMSSEASPPTLLSAVEEASNELDDDELHYSRSSRRRRTSSSTRSRSRSSSNNNTIIGATRGSGSTVLEATRTSFSMDHDDLDEEIGNLSQADDILIDLESNETL